MDKEEKVDMLTEVVAEKRKRTMGLVPSSSFSLMKCKCWKRGTGAFL